MAEPRNPKPPKTRRKSPRSTAAKPSAKTKAKAVVEDAVVISEDVAQKATDAVSDAVSDTAASVEEAVETSSDAVTASEPETSPEPAPDPVAKETPAAEPVPDPVVEPESTPQPVASPPPPPEKSGGMSVIFGGIIAALLGAGGLYLAQLQGWISIGPNTEALEARVSEQSTELAQLTKALEALRAAQPDLAPVTTQLGELAAADTTASEGLATLTISLGALTGRLDATDERLSELALQPIPKAELPAEVTAAFEAELASVQTGVDARFVELQKALDDKLAAIDAAQTAAVDQSAELAKAAELAQAQAAMARVNVALDSGEGFAEALQEVTEAGGVVAPALLIELAEAGAPTLTGLQSSFPAVARTALASSLRDAESTETGGGVASFLRTQFGARSLEPREGSDPDAVLSRAEAAVASGDLDTALSELDALPPAGQADMADWRAQADTRKAALTASAELSALIDSN